MDLLPLTSQPKVVRTDFSDESAWSAIVSEIRAPQEYDFVAYVDVVDDPAYLAASSDQLVSLVRGEDALPFLISVDAIAVGSGEHPVQVVDLVDEPGRVFRAVTRAVQGIENNLSIGNMSFADFADAVDSDGVFRDFRD